MQMSQLLVVRDGKAKMLSVTVFLYASIHILIAILDLHVIKRSDFV